MAVWQRVKDGLAEMGPVEARGYIRARALGVVKQETTRLIEQEGAKVARQSQRIESAATELLITTMVGQAAQRPGSQSLRRAA
jgi:hypothetical protein